MKSLFASLAKKTTEFKFLLGLIIYAEISLWFSSNKSIWAIAWAICFVCYNISRGMYKRNRVIEVQKSDYQTTEFKATTFGASELLVMVAFQAISPELSFLLIAAIGGSYILARGHTKGLTPHNNRVQVLR